MSVLLLSQVTRPKFKIKMARFKKAHLNWFGIIDIDLTY